MITLSLTEKQIQILQLALDQLDINDLINEGKDKNGHDIDPEDSDTDLPITTQEVKDLTLILDQASPLPIGANLKELQIINSLIVEKLGTNDGEEIEYTRDELEAIWEKIPNEAH